MFFLLQKIGAGRVKENAFSTKTPIRTDFTEKTPAERVFIILSVIF